MPNWMVDKRSAANDKSRYIVVLDDKDNFVARTYSTHDARLIAAAPDLLSVARGCLGYLQALPVVFRPDEAWFIPLRKAIEKAQKS